MRALKARKLTLSKVTIADLAMNEMSESKGGVFKPTFEVCSTSSCDACNTAFSCENTCINCSFPC